MPMRSTFEISTKIILLKIDGFLKGWILNITPLKYVPPPIVQGYAHTTADQLRFQSVMLLVEKG